MQTHVRKTVSAFVAVLRHLTWIRRSVPVDTYKSLDGLSSYLYNTLTSMLNAAARYIFRLRRYDHIIPALVDLHWLRVPERVRLKLQRWYAI
jgi:hypothetical protein